MESYEEYQARQKSYTEMLEMAQKIHPDMQVRLDQFTHTEWEMFMPTTFIEKVRACRRVQRNCCLGMV